MRSILIVEDDVTFSLMLRRWLKKKDFDAEAVSNVAKARRLIEEQGAPDLVLSDFRLPEENGLGLLRWMRGKGLDTPFLIMTGYADVPGAVEAIKEGAYDYIAKPMQPDLLLQKINEAIATQAPGPAAAQAAAEDEFIEGTSPQARELFRYVELVAPTDMSVLINGDSGTGKEYVAHRIHELSPRRTKPFVAIDCGAIPRDLAASEFFGHIKGAFTGALADKTGAFAAANGGTLFLDEIGNLDYETQQRLLRALQERKIRPVGSDREIQVDIRLISATNENLETAIAKGTFREDVYHRINEFTLKMPALRERKEDIPLFARFFLKKAGVELRKDVKDFSPEALQLICQYAWPGNLRQMRNIVRRAVLLSEDSIISPRQLSEELKENSRGDTGLPPHPVPLRDKESERERIVQTLAQTGNNKSLAARLLGIDRKTLYNKMKSYGLDQDS